MASSSSRKPKGVAKAWLAIFAIWGILLSGALASFVGSPGVLQAFHLTGLLNSKRDQLGALQSEIDRLKEESSRLERSKTTQHREIRRTLGYAAPDEIIFDFNTAERF